MDLAQTEDKASWGNVSIPDTAQQLLSIPSIIAGSHLYCVPIWTPHFRGDSDKCPREGKLANTNTAEKTCGSSAQRRRITRLRTPCSSGCSICKMRSILPCPCRPRQMRQSREGCTRPPSLLVEDQVPKPTEVELVLIALDLLCDVE